MKGNFLLSCLLLIMISFLLQPRNFTLKKTEYKLDVKSPALFIPKQTFPPGINELNPAGGTYFHVDSLEMEG